MTNPREFGSRQSRVIAMALASLLIMAFGVQWATGQGAVSEYLWATYDSSLLMTDPKTGEVKLNEKVVKQAAFTKNQVLLGSIPYAENADKFKYYYKNYFYKSLMRPENLHTLPEKRKELVDDLKRAKSKEVHNQLRTDTFEMMKKFVPHPKVHPAVRFNAMLIIGDLNAEEQSIQFRYANPLPEALDFILEQYESPNQLDAVKLAAMIGILRHEQLNRARQTNRLPDVKQQKITQLMLALIKAKDPPAGRLREGHVWMQRRAVEILAEMGLVGSDDAVTQEVTGLLRDHAADLTLRCSAAEALGKTIQAKAPAKSKIGDPAKESLQLAALLVEACHKELERIEAWQKKKMEQLDPTGSYGGYGGSDGGMGSGMMPGGGGYPGGGMMPGGSGMMPGGGGMMPGGGGMMPGGGGMMPGGGMPGGGMPGYGEGEGTGGMMVTGPKDPLVELFRRQIKYEIDCVRKGMSGVARLVSTDPKKPAFKELNSDIDAVWKATDPPPYLATLPGLHKSVKDSLKSLETKTAALLPKKPVAPEEAESDEPSDAPANAPAALAPAAATGPGKAGRPAGTGATPPAAARSGAAAPPAAATPPNPAADSDAPPAASPPAGKKAPPAAKAPPDAKTPPGAKTPTGAKAPTGAATPPAGAPARPK